MTFHDLPPNSRDLPLDDATLRLDLVDLIVSLDSREHGCLALLFLDEQHICTMPVVIDEMGIPEPETLRHVLRNLFDNVRPPAMVAALGRRGSALFTDLDRACHQVLFEVADELGITLLATCVASDNAVRELPDHLRLAS